MERTFVIFGAIFAFFGVAAGAFGAHALKEVLAPDKLEIFRTGVLYQLVHALGLFAIAWASTRWPGGATTAAGWCFVAGIVLFSGSLYVLALSRLTVFGAVTPVGGLALLAGWACLVAAGLVLAGVPLRPS